MDPLSSSYPYLSPFSAFDNSPIAINDPDGGSGEPIFNKKEGKIIIYMDIYFYGTSSLLSNPASDGKNAITVLAVNKLESELNKHPSTALGPDGKSYPVEFRIDKFQIISDENKAKERILANSFKEGYNPRANFVRIEDDPSTFDKRRNSLQNVLKIDGTGRSQEKIVENSMTAPDNSVFLNSTWFETSSLTHEVAAHWLYDRGNNSHIYDYTKNPSATTPSIRTVMASKNVPGDKSNLLIKNPTTGNYQWILDNEKREVLPEDKSNLHIIWYPEGSKYNGRQGSSSNTYFTKEATEVQQIPKN